MRKPYWPLTMTLAALIVVTWGPPALAQQPAEQQVMELANVDRAQHGLAPLKWDPALPQAAAQHAQIMAEQPAALSHQYAGEPDQALKSLPTSRAGEYYPAASTPCAERSLGQGGTLATRAQSTLRSRRIAASR